MVDAFLDEKTYALIDELELIAKKTHETNVATLALAWVRGTGRRLHPVIIGARAGFRNSTTNGSGPSM